MYSTEKLLQMLTNRKASVRYDACEWLRVRQESSPAIVRALERAANDEDKEVAQRAKYALQADVHHQMAIEMGIIKPDNPEANRKLLAPPLSAQKIELKSLLAGILGVFFVIISLVSIIQRLSDQSLIRKSKSWPVTQGEVISAEIVTYNTEYGDSSHPEIIYRYTVSGIEYSCEIRTNQKETYRKLPVDTLVAVYYDPNRPKVCVSEYDTAGFPWGELFFIALGSFFIWLVHNDLIG